MKDKGRATLILIVGTYITQTLEMGRKNKKL